MEVVGQGDLTAQLQYIAPDDGNKDDKSVIDLHVPKPIAADGYVQLKISFTIKFPETLARTGWKRDFLLGGQWFPKVGVWWHGAWNCHQFHGDDRILCGLRRVRREAHGAAIRGGGASGMKSRSRTMPTTRRR